MHDDLTQFCLQHVARLGAMGQECRAAPYLALATGSITLIELAPGHALQMAEPPRCLCWLHGAFDDHAGSLAGKMRR